MRADDHDSLGAGLYIGPILLAVFLASGACRTICEDRSFASPIDGTLVFVGRFLAQRYGFKLAGRSTVLAVSPICA